MHNFERKWNISFENEALIFGLKNFGTIWTKLLNLDFLRHNSNFDNLNINKHVNYISLTVALDSKTKNRNYPRSQLENFLSVFYTKVRWIFYFRGRLNTNGSFSVRFWKSKLFRIQIDIFCKKSSHFWWKNDQFWQKSEHF